jgi:hypothetical protein
MSVLFNLTPIFICLGQYFVTVIMILVLILMDSPWIIKGLITLLFLVGVFMLPFWYKTFFDKDFVGLDRPIVLHWSENIVSFRGGYFYIEIPVENILDYQKIGIKRWNSTFTLKVKVKKLNNAIVNMWLSTTMPCKNEFVSFLDSLLKKQTTD